MFYTIYKITNLLDGKIYIGKHQTNNLNDGYMGSGKLLRRAVAKHGIEFFSKEILFCFDNEENMNAKEAELVTEEFCSRDDTYNLCVGGNGGFSYINREIWNSDNNHIRLRNLSLMTHEQRSLNGKKSGIKNILEAHKSGKIKYDTFTGKHHTQNSKIKMSETKKKDRVGVGEKNSQYGTMWITNGQENKKIKKDIDIIPDGWYKGRN